MAKNEYNYSSKKQNRTEKSESMQQQISISGITARYHSQGSCYEQKDKAEWQI